MRLESFLICFFSKYLNSLIRYRNNLIGTCSVRDIQTFFKYLKKVSYLQFEMLNDICIIDNPSKPKRFNVSYILSSIKKNNRFFLKTSTQSALPSVSIFYKSANWIEREC